MARLFIIVSILSITLSCNRSYNEAQREKVGISYGLIHASFVFNKAHQQKFIDELTTAALRLKENNDAIIDAENLRTLLDTARQANESRMKLIQNAEEADSEIKLREKALVYTTLFHSAYDKEFKQFIEFVESDSPNKLEKASEILQPILLKIKEAQITFEKADNQMRQKYQIETFD